MKASSKSWLVGLFSCQCDGLLLGKKNILMQDQTVKPTTTTTTTHWTDLLYIYRREKKTTKPVAPFSISAAECVRMHRALDEMFVHKSYLASCPLLDLNINHKTEDRRSPHQVSRNQNHYTVLYCKHYTKHIINAQS